MRALVLPIGAALHACSGVRVVDPAAASGEGLPAWDHVPTPHPPGATNPPSPVLLVTPEGACFKHWVSPFLPPEQRRDRVTPCSNAEERVDECGTQVSCPPQAGPLLEAWKAEQPG